jgi:type IV pilus assembly protein PilA
MINKFRVRVQSEKGFTLVELLVVMLILGLLAAIAIPSFFNQRDKARDADAKASVRTAETAMETVQTDNNGDYLIYPAGGGAGATPTAQQLADVESSLQEVVDDGRLTVTSTDDDYSVAVESEVAATQVFTIARDDQGIVSLTCTTGGEAGCPEDETWD